MIDGQKSFPKIQDFAINYPKSTIVMPSEILGHPYNYDYNEK